MNIQPFVDAVFAHQWVLFGALVIGLFVALVKQGQLGTWLQAKMPPRFIPFFAPCIGALGLTSSEVIAGKPWQGAVVDGINAGILAVFGHQLIIEGMRNGKELVKDKAPSNDNASAKAGFVRLHLLNALGLGTLILICALPSVAASVTLTNCALFTKEVVPIAKLQMCVEGDALAGKTLAQMLIDCGPDAAAIFTTLLTSKNPKVLASPAYAEASKVKESLSAPTLDGGK